MMETMNEKRFDDRIAARLKSDEWDLRIAGRVLRRRRTKRLGIAAAGTASSLALAATLVFAVLPGLWGGAKTGEELNYFVNAQVTGTWNTVFTESAMAVGTESSVTDAQYDDDMDAMIDETLEQRL
jgi:hypothetical protein